MRVVVESELPCRVERAWEEVQLSRLLVEVAAPFVAIRPAPQETLPERWPLRVTVRVRSYLFGVIPLGTRDVYFDRIDPLKREMETRERDPLVRRWDHIISVQAAGSHCCRYRDQIDIEAGWLTFGVWLFAQCLYRHRQRRWKTVARRLAESAGALDPKSGLERSSK
jgi:hypothetical protein